MYFDKKMMTTEYKRELPSPGGSELFWVEL